MKREEIVDIAKGIGIFLVVLGHVPLPTGLCTAIFLFHMPLFFFLSGLFFHPNEPTLYGIYKKVRTILIPYFFFAFGGNASNLLRSILFHKDYDANFLHLFSGSNSPLWFLLCLFSCYLISKLIAIVTNNDHLRLLVSVLVAIVGIVFCKKNIHLPFFGTQALLMLFYYSVGTYVYKRFGFNWLNSVGNMSTMVASLLFILCIVPFSIRPNVSTLEFYYPIVFFIGSLLGILLTLKVSQIIKNLSGKLKSTLLQMGNLSLFIYGFHFYILFHMYFFTIPVLIRSTSDLPLQWNGIYLRESYWLGVCLVPFVILISFLLGKWCKRKLWFFFSLKH